MNFNSFVPPLFYAANGMAESLKRKIRLSVINRHFDRRRVV